MSEINNIPEYRKATFEDVWAALLESDRQRKENERILTGKSVAIIESKYKAHGNDIPKVINKAKTFKANYPEYSKHNIYLGLASMVFYSELEKECINQGIAVIKQVGETAVVNYTNLKTF